MSDERPRIWFRHDEDCVHAPLNPLHDLLPTREGCTCAPVMVDPNEREREREFVTQTGCTVSVKKPDVWNGQPAGEVTLVLEMRQPGDGRRAEVALTWEERRELAWMLEENW